MRALVATTAIVICVFLLAGCGFGGSNNASSSTPTPTATSAPQATAQPTKAAPMHPTAAPAAAPSQAYLGFIRTVCKALAAKDTGTLSASLPYYQYNSGLRYGMLGDGEGETGDPSLFSTWLQNTSVRCRYFTPDQAGHGTLLADGWIIPAAWSLIEFDIFNGKWKINDFTFGSQAALWRAMHTSQPILPYRG